MGHFHDKFTSLFLPPSNSVILTGLASQSLLVVDHIWANEFQFSGAGTAFQILPFTFSQVGAVKGIYLRSLDCYYSNSDAAGQTINFGLIQQTLPVNGATHAASVLDAVSGNATAGNKVSTYTIAAPKWWPPEYTYFFFFYIDTPAALDVTFYGLRLNLEWRL
jgi:hypothetical protein